MPDFNVKIAFWDDGEGNCPVADALDSMPVKESAWIQKKNGYFEQKTYRQLEHSKHWGKIANIDYELYELKYHSKPPYRAICVAWKNRIVILSIFKGSGSGGNVEKYVEKAIERAEEWKARFPQ